MVGLEDQSDLRGAKYEHRGYKTNESLCTYNQLMKLKSQDLLRLSRSEE